MPHLRECTAIAQSQRATLFSLCSESGPMKKTLKINLEVLKVLSNSEVNSVKGGGATSAVTATGIGEIASGRLNVTTSI